MMNRQSYDKVQQLFRNHAAHAEPTVKDMQLFQVPAALRVLADAEAGGLELWGIEGFKVFPPGGIRPHIEHTLDFAELGLPMNEFYQAAKRFLSERIAEDLWFELTITDKKRNS